MESNFKNKLAFTLAEVLLTLAIVGIVAALTIPALLSNVNNSENIATYKKLYSTFNSVFLRMTSETGGLFAKSWGYTGHTFNEGTKIISVFCEHLSCQKQCTGGDSISEGCFNSNIKYPSGTAAPLSDINADSSHEFGAILNNGSSFTLMTHTDTPDCTNSDGCGTLIIDTNGPGKGPNTVSKDIFAFCILNNKISPHSSSDCYSGSNLCNSSKPWGCSLDYLAR